MPSINMIAPRRAEKRRLERAMRKLAVLVIAQLVFAVALGGWVFMKTLTTRATIAELNSQMQVLTPKIKKVAELERQTAELKPKVELLSKAKSRTMRWYNTLDQLTQSVPSSTWLTRIATLSPAGGDTTLNINGVTSEQARVGETMMRLQTNPDFRSVDLHYTQRGSGVNTQSLEFEIGASMTSDDNDKSKGVTPNGSGQS